MTKKEIDNILKKESGIILIEKESEHSFFEAMFGSSSSILSLIYFITRKKLDFLILTENRITLFIRNKIYSERILNGINSIKYNGISSSLEVTEQDQQFSFPLSRLRISYEESKLIKRKLSDFDTRKTQVK